MEYFVVFVVVIGAGIIALKMYVDQQVVECVNCSIKLTRAKLRKNGGCIRCGTDLVRTVKKPRR